MSGHRCIGHTLQRLRGSAPTTAATSSSGRMTMPKGSKSARQRGFDVNDFNKQDCQ